MAVPSQLAESDARQERVDLGVENARLAESNAMKHFPFDYAVNGGANSVRRFLDLTSGKWNSLGYLLLA